MLSTATAKQGLIFIAIFLILPVQILAQSGDVPVPTEISKPTETPTPAETPVSTISAPAQAVSAPRVTPPPVSPISTPLPSTSLSPLLPPLSTVSEYQASSPSITTVQVSNDLVLGIVVALIATTSSAFGYAVYKGKTQKKNKKNDRCGNIRELLEQKKKELEESIRSWPEAKIKELAQEKVVSEFKKNEDTKKILETAENLKAKHDKLKETIELLQKRYDLCVLELPSMDKVKTLKFKGFKAKSIIEGSKTATMRLFDDKDLKAEDDLELVNSDEGKFFAKAKIIEVIQKRLGEVDVIDLDGHEKWNNKEEMLESFKKYYGDGIDLDTPAKIIRFKIIK